MKTRILQNMFKCLTILNVVFRIFIFTCFNCDYGFVQMVRCENGMVYTYVAHDLLISCRLECNFKVYSSKSPHHITQYFDVITIIILKLVDRVCAQYDLIEKCFLFFFILLFSLHHHHLSFIHVLFLIKYLVFY